jgi:hypothetical protein
VLVLEFYLGGRLVGILRNLGPAQNGGSLWKAEKWFEREA